MRFAPPRLPTALSIRQVLAHKRHRGHRETDQHQRVLDGHNRRCPERPAGDDRGRKMVESYRVLSDCDFHTSGGVSETFVKRCLLSILRRSGASSASQQTRPFDHRLRLPRRIVPDPRRHQGACLFFPHWSLASPEASCHFVWPDEPVRRFQASRIPSCPR